MSKRKILTLILLIIFIGLILIAFLTPINPANIVNNVKSIFTKTDTQNIPKEINITKTGKKEEDIIVNDQIILKVYSSSQYTPQNEALLPRKGDKLLVVEISLSNNSNNDINVEPYDFILVDQSNQTYNYTISDKDPQIVNRPVKKGDSIKGFLTFQIPEKENPRSIIYSPKYDINQKIEVQL